MFVHGHVSYVYSTFPYLQLLSKVSCFDLDSLSTKDDIVFQMSRKFEELVSKGRSYDWTVRETVPGMIQARSNYLTICILYQLFIINNISPQFI